MSVSDAAHPGSVRKAQFAVVPMWVHRRIIATRTRTMALAVYVELVGQYAGSSKDADGLRVWPEVQQIADSMGVPKRNIHRALDVLVDCGVVLKKRTVRRNQYWLPQEDPEAFAETLADFQSATSGTLDSVQGATSGTPRSATSGTPRSATSGTPNNPVPITQTQEPLSPPPSPKRPAVSVPVSSERETEAAPTTTTTTTTAERVVREAGVVTAGEEQPFVAWAEDRHRVQGGGWWRRVAANGDLPGLAAAWRAERAPQAAQRSSLRWECVDCRAPGQGTPPADRVCATCRAQAERSVRAACAAPSEATGDARAECPGHGGRPCGRPPRAGGLCWRCRTAAEAESRAAAVR